MQNKLSEAVLEAVDEFCLSKSPGVVKSPDKVVQDPPSKISQ
jgi:hypothetical protein